MMVRSARRGVQSCDFCGAERVAYRYPCEGGGQWLACLECAISIDSENMEDLALRAAAEAAGRNPKVARKSADQMLRGIRASHARFMQGKGAREEI
jgi:hypothetical protein